MIKARHFTSIAGALRSLVRAEKKWAPRPAPIAVVDGGNLAVLEPLFGGQRYEVVHIDGGVLYLHPRVLASTLRHLVRIGVRSWTDVTTAYVIAVLERIEPAIVVTFVDSAVFDAAGERYRRARFLEIQNGGRLLERDRPKGRSPQIRLREYACLGRYDIEEYTRYGARVEHYYPVGSLIDSYYRARRPAQIAKEFDLCLPSQFKKSARTLHSERLDSFDVLARHVRRFCDAHGTTLCVPLRWHPDFYPADYEWEREYLASILGDQVPMFGNVRAEHTTYGLVDRSRVSIGMHTTVLREGFGRGNRILSCNYSGNPVYTFPLPGPWTLTDPSYDVFEQRLLWLLNASEEEYGKVCGDLPSYLVSYDEKRPTHVFLQQLIADAVRGVPEPAATSAPATSAAAGSRAQRLA